ncbi:GPP34 family phosphoprotein [Amycolatopsis rubida]|uniref:Golgi phosphoprotein 3 (GPP34) n=1 Tax=Amycolatopsis rubida TaxID=112413 RepID=A0A1I5XA69_9PSEU|nr:GPP34 family phosphoprotein [Amycolatopsis rubida]SFQ28873.1 Golgi phosphoprotein 3 (GPP34) [Amycolatopsis rubida]
MTRAHAAGPAYRGSRQLADLVLAAVHLDDPDPPAIRDRDALAAVLAVSLLAEQVLDGTIAATRDKLVWLQEPVAGPPRDAVLRALLRHGLPAPIAAVVDELARDSAETVWQRLVAQGVAQRARSRLRHGPGYAFTVLAARQWPRALLSSAPHRPGIPAHSAAPLAVALWRVLRALGLATFSLPAGSRAWLEAADPPPGIEPLLRSLPAPRA